MSWTTKLNPAVDKKVLMLIAGLMWAAVGLMLLIFSAIWLQPERIKIDLIFASLGIFVGLLVHRFGFSHIVDKNLARIVPMQEKRCIFSFVPWKSYLIILIMVAMGRLLRMSAIPKSYLAIVYITMGLAMFLSSFKYFTALYTLIKSS